MGLNKQTHFPFTRYRFEVFHSFRDKFLVQVIHPNLARNLVGMRSTSAEIAKMLTKMFLKSEVLGDGRIRCIVPPTRADVIHACDVYEDIAIAFGYNNIQVCMCDYLIKKNINSLGLCAL